jgi:hypothetical protein
MKIKFLRSCTAPQRFYITRCECCGPEPQTEPTFFYEGQEEDPNEVHREIDLSSLKYKEDYVITEYP